MVCKVTDGCDNGPLWRDATRVSRTATYFHTPGWAGVLQRTFPRWHICPITIELADGNICVIPRMRTRTAFPGLYYYESMVPGVYGGPVFLRPAGDDHWHAVWQILSRQSNWVMMGNPFVQAYGQPSAIGRRATTHVLELAAGFGGIWKGFQRTHRTGVVAAEREGVLVSVARDRQAVDEYYSLYRSAWSRWGTGARGFHPLTLFRNLFDSPEYGVSVRLWLAWHKGRIVSGAWLLYQSEHVAYWHSAMDRTAAKFRPTHLLLTNAIKDACTGGFRWFDFGPSGSNEGVQSFKTGFGARPLAFHSYRRLRIDGRVLRARAEIVQRYFRRCAL